MAARRNIPWPQLLVEGIAIVASILLAFAIDAWWDDRSDRADEQAAIRRLIAEYEANLAELQHQRSQHESVFVATDALLNMIGPDPAPPVDEADFARILIDCVTNPTFDPRLGTTNSLIASGRIALLQDEELQSALTEWPAQVQYLIEWQEIERMHGEELILDVTFNYIAWPDFDVLLGHSTTPSRFDSDIVGLLSDRRFEGLLDNRRWNHRNALEQIDELAATTEDLISRLRAELDD